jgi:hypothetical protein
MAWGHGLGRSYSAEGSDAKVDLIGNTGCAVATTGAKTGTYAVTFPSLLSGPHHLTTAQTLRPPFQNDLNVFQMAPRLSGAPSSGKDISLLSTLTDNGRYVRVGDDRKIRIYDKNGNLVAGPSTSTLPTSGAGPVLTIVFEMLTLPTVWVAVIFDTTEEIAVDTGVSPTDFWGTGVIVFGDVEGAKGANVHVDDLTWSFSSVAGDAPHTVAFPILEGYGLLQRPPTDDGTHTAWTGNAFDVDDVDDTNDINTATKGAKETNKFDTSNPIPAGYTVKIVNTRVRGRLQGAAKLGASSLLRLSGSEAVGVLGAWTTDFEPNGRFGHPRPGGGTWTRADFDLTGGVSDLEFGVQAEDNPSFDTGIDVSACFCPEIFATNSDIGLTTTPTSILTPRRRILAQVI